MIPPTTSETITPAHVRVALAAMDSRDDRRAVKAWHDDWVGHVLHHGAQRGWCWRVSVTQAGWTDEGVLALRFPTPTSVSPPCEVHRVAPRRAR